MKAKGFIVNEIIKSLWPSKVTSTNFMTLSDELVDSANRNGGTDNVTVVVVEI